MMTANCLILTALFHCTRCTIDLNLPELQYLADHLHPEECRKLVALLHFKSFELPRAVDQAEEKVSKDIPCLRLLLHWNSQPGEGRGETHEAVQHRLRQIGRSDLADWLGKTVFHELGEELQRGLTDAFEDIINSTEKEKNISQPTLAPSTISWDPLEWIAFDTICWTFLVGLTLLTLGVLAKVVCMLTIKKKRRKRKYRNKHYNQLENEDSQSTESEDRFDIRTYESNSIQLNKLPRSSGRSLHS